MILAVLNTIFCNCVDNGGAVLLDQLSDETTDGSWSFVGSNVPVLNESMKKNLCMKKKHAYQNADMKSSKAMILPVLNAILAIA